MGLVPRSRECSSWYAQSVQAVVQLAATNQLRIVSYLTEVHVTFSIKVHMRLPYVYRKCTVSLTTPELCQLTILPLCVWSEKR